MPRWCEPDCMGWSSGLGERCQELFLSCPYCRPTSKASCSPYICRTTSESCPGTPSQGETPKKKR